MKRYSLFIISLFVLAGVCGCFYEPLQWSEDGKTITGYFYTQDPYGNDQFQLIEIDTQTRVPTVLLSFAEGKTGRYCYRSPDGTKLFYLIPHEAIEGKGPETVTATLFSTADSEITNLASLPFPGNDFMPEFNPWHPNGKALLFVQKNTTTNNEELLLYDLASTTLTQLFSADTLLPVWSPDGEKIAVIAKNTAEGESLFSLIIIHKDGTHKIIEDAFPGSTYEELTNYLLPAWFPDGKRLIYSSNDNLWISNIEDGAKKQLTNDKAIQLLPDVSPDGTTIVFNEIPPDTEIDDEYGNNTIHIGIISSAGGDKQALVSLPGEAYLPKWSPDGKNIAFLFAKQPATGFLPGIVTTNGEITWMPVNGFQEIGLGYLFLFLADQETNPVKKLYYRQNGKTLLEKIIRNNKETDWGGQALGILSSYGLYKEEND